MAENHCAHPAPEIDDDPAAPRPTARRWFHRRPSITVRLLVLVLVPLLGLGIAAMGTTQARGEAARSAEQVHHGVDRIARLVTLRSALYHEQAYQSIVFWVRSFGVMTVPQVSEFSGVDLEGRLHDYKAQADAASAALGPDAGVVTPADLVDARVRTERIALTSDDPTAAYDPLAARIDAAKARILRDLQPDLARAGATGVSDDLAALRLELALVPGLFNRHQARTMLFIERGDRDASRRRITAADAVEQRTLAELQEHSDPAIAAEAASVLADPLALQFRADMAEYDTGAYPLFVAGTGDWGRHSDADKADQHNTDRIFGLMERTASGVATAAAALEADAHHDLVVAQAGSLGIGALSLAVCVLLARSITRPLRRLRDHAAELSAGNVAIGPLPTTGPPDIAVTAGAVNELVDNLRLLDARNRALAELDFDAEVLTQRLPGALGASLDGSLQALTSEREELTGRMLHQASHDEVTTLHNRNAAIEQLGQAVARAQRVSRGVGVLVIDVQGFKRFNDTHGHDFGDRLLRQLGRRLLRCSPGASLVARIGADQFLVLIEDLATADPATELARELLAAVATPVQVRGTTVTVHAACGVSFSWNGVDDVTQVLAGADLALERAKRRGPDAIEIYDGDLQAQLLAQAATEEALTAALRAGDDELFLLYQPVVDLDSGRLTAIEALIRWDRPGLGLQAPDSFIPVAERSPLIVELDRWVLDRVARQMAEWAGDPVLGQVDVAVNVSGRHIAAGSLHDHVAALLDGGAIDPHRLVIEVTETALVDDLPSAAAQLQGLRRRGVRVALDDFGTGYTSVGQLRELPVDVVKIDRSFVQRAASDTDRALLRLIADMGQIFGTTITAEGIETPEQYDLLQGMRCDNGQGFLMSRPLAPEALRSWAEGRELVSATADVSASW